jgi:hypothetical protein
MYFPMAPWPSSSLFPKFLRQVGHSGTITCAAISPDASFVVSAGSEAPPAGRDVTWVDFWVVTWVDLLDFGEILVTFD